MEAFAFHPELFETRSEVLELLAAHEFVWLSDFSSVDLLHDLYGLEVCGVRDRADAIAIERLLRRHLPWRHSRRYHKDAGSREPGWKVIISRDAEDDGDRRQRIE